MGLVLDVQHRVAVEGTLVIAPAAREARVARLVHVSRQGSTTRSAGVGDVAEDGALLRAPAVGLARALEGLRQGLISLAGLVRGYVARMSEPAIVVGDRKELTYLLSQAAELEHGLMCEYLYAAFSLKSSAGPGVRNDQLAAVERWRGMILGIAAEEMLHWAMVQNLLTAVGS